MILALLLPVLLQGTATEAPVELPAETPTEVANETLREDGTLVINLLPLAPPPPEMCEESEIDPLEPGITVCRKTALSPRLGTPLPETEAVLFGSAIPRAKVKLSENAEGQANATNPSVGGWNAQGAEAKVKIEF